VPLGTLVPVISAVGTIAVPGAAAAETRSW
jgi:hypothetical protein